MLDKQDQSRMSSQKYSIDPSETLSPNVKRILVVNDEPTILRLIDRVLSNEGHSVDVAEDGQTACPMIQGTRYDCVILDWYRPGMPGSGLYRLMEETY
jgi:DNA-binding response OmpR family regulator